MLSWRATRRTSGLIITLAVGAGMLVPTSANAAGTEVTGQAPGDVVAAASSNEATSSSAATVTASDIPTTAPDEREPAPPAAESDELAEEPVTDPSVVAELEATDLAPFSMLGVTWESGLDEASTRVEARWRADGDWSDWTELHADPSRGEGGRPGTEPQWVGEADGAQVRVIAPSDAKPEGLALSTIDPGAVAPEDTTAGASAATDVTPAIAVTQAATVGQPSIILRASWGASNAGRCDSPIYGSTTRGAVIHHTAGTNTYTQSESKAIVKATQAYHMKAREWCDIGYNFLVDKYGQIFEGRAGGITKQVRAAHSGNAAVNQEAMGVSMMGTFETVAPSDALKSSVADLVAWRFAQYGLPAKGTYSLGGKTLNRIAGHRNVVSTACPGAAAYAWLSAPGGLRDQVESRLATGGVTAEVGGRSVSGVTTTGFTFGWKAFSQAAKYQVYVSTSSEAPGVCGGTRCRSVFASSTPSTAVTGLAAGVTHYAWVRAISSTGAELTAWQALPKTVKLAEVVQPPPPPPAPQPTAEVGGRSASAITTSGFTLRWRAFSGARKYQVYVSSSSRSPGVCGGTVCRSVGASSSPGTAVSGLTSGATYYAWVRAMSSSGSALTAWQSVPKTVRLASPQAAASPTAEVGGRSASAITTSGFTLRWRAFSGARKYQVYVSSSSRSPGVCGGTVCRSVGASSSPGTAVSGLAPGVTHYAWVRAMSSSGSALTAWQSVPKTVRLKSASNTTTVPSSNRIAIKGHGYGHGIGMSQHGAQGAALAGVSYEKILSQYYPGTKLASKSGDIRVLISQDTTSDVQVAATSGLRFRKMVSSFDRALPTSVGGQAVTSWRIVQVTSNMTQSTLQYRTTGGWQSYDGIRWTGDGQFYGPSRISLVLPGGSTVKYRGAIRSAVPSKGSTSRKTVNILPIDHYVRGVIAAEMPSGWAPAALRAQAVAARTYGVRALTPSRYYDICSTTACQVYGGQSRETSSTDAAVRATANKILTYQGAPAFTQFSSSSGGYTATGSQPYLKAVADRYDGWSGNSNHSWSTTVAASTIQKAYPAIGTLRQLTITDRSGAGDWGGRVEKISLIGSKKTVVISGNDARWAFGLKSNWFNFGV